MAVQAVEPTTYPLSAATAEVLRRPLFGHVIDGERCRRLDGATMPVIEPATGARDRRRGGGAEADVDRAVRSARAAFEDGRWRNLAPLEKERRLRRLAALLAERGALFGELDVLDAGPAARVHRRSSCSSAVSGHRLLRRLADEDPRHDPGGARRTSRPCTPCASRSASSGSSCPGTARRSSSTSSRRARRAATRSCSSPPSRRRCRRR